MYNVTDRQSFINITEWMNDIQKHVGTGIVKVLVGNKCDLNEQRKVSHKEGAEFAYREKMLFFETSAKAKINIEEAFMALIRQMYESLPEGERRIDADMKKIAVVEKKKNCCK